MGSRGLNNTKIGNIHIEPRVNGKMIKWGGADKFSLAEWEAVIRTTFVNF